MSDRKFIIKALMDTRNVEKGFDNIKKKGGGIGKSIGSGLSSVASKFGAIAIGAAAAARTVKLAGDAFKAWVGEQEAINDLNVALQSTGQFSEQASIKLQDMAGAIQDTTTFGNEAILSFQAQAIQLGTLTDETDEVVRASMGMANTYKQSVPEAMKAATKFLNGYSDTLGRTGIKVKKGADRQERLNALVEAGAVGFANIEGEAKTLTGAQKRLNNAWGDFLEILVDATGISMPATVVAIDGITDAINALGKAVKENTNEMDEDVNHTSRAFGDAYRAIGFTILGIVAEFSLAAVGASILYKEVIYGGIKVDQAFIAGLRTMSSAFQYSINVLIDGWNVTARIIGAPVMTHVSFDTSGLDAAEDRFDYFAEVIGESLQDSKDSLGKLIAGLVKAGIEIGKTANKMNSLSSADNKTNTGNKIDIDDDTEGSTSSKRPKPQGPTGKQIKQVNDAAEDLTDTIKETGTAAKDLADTLNSLPTDITVNIDLNVASERFKTWVKSIRNYFEKFKVGFVTQIKQALEPDKGKCENCDQEASSTTEDNEEAISKTQEKMTDLGMSAGESIGKGFMENDWGALGSLVGKTLQDSIAQATQGGTFGGGFGGGLVGGLLSFGIGSLISGIFGGGGNKGSVSDPIYTYETNQIKPEDIVTAFLTVSQSAQQRAAGRGISNLQAMIAAQGATGIGV